MMCINCPAAKVSIEGILECHCGGTIVKAVEPDGDCLYGIKDYEEHVEEQYELYLKQNYIHHIKVNIPTTEEEYEKGHGEGCWFLVNEETKKAYEEDVEGGTYNGILDNEPIEHPMLKLGDLLPIEMRGKKRPVVSLKELKKKGE